jgi:hypothetical protein
LKSQLKNRRAYARKHGFLQGGANLDNQESDDDDSDVDTADENAEDENKEEEEVDNYDGGDAPEN